MNPTKLLPQSNDEPLRIRDVVIASAIVVGACATVAIAFTVIGTCYATDATFKRIFRKGGRHVPR